MTALTIYTTIVAVTGLTVSGITMMLIRGLTLGYGVGFNQQVIAPVFSKIILFLLNIKIENYISKSDKKLMYIFNHNSFLDLLIIPYLRLKNTRFIISEDVKTILPLHFCNLGVNVLYVPVKKNKQKRLQFFEKLAYDLSKKKYSVICSPEGQHTFKHGISEFNNEVFDVATKSKMPFQCLFFQIPIEKNPLESFEIKPCVIKVYSKDIINTSNWDSKAILENKNNTRIKFLQYYKEAFGNYGDSNV